MTVFVTVCMFLWTYIDPFYLALYAGASLEGVSPYPTGGADL